jgi:[protein-PII] uridylyltransferase
VADVAARLRDERDRLRTAGPEPGRAWCEAWTEVVDAGIRELVAAAAHGEAVTVVATGGYGRREMCPSSDVDLLLLHDGLEEPQLESLVRDVVYPLWDAKLKVGYAVRARREAITAAADLDTATAVLDGRVLAGAEGRFTSVRGDIITWIRRKPRRLLDQLARADAERRAGAGAAAETLEPDLKSGAGGLRDVQSLRWAAAALVGEVGLDPLVSARYLGAVDRPRLARAYERLLATRVALHLELDRPGDVLRLEVQHRVAARLGYSDGTDDRDTAAHRLLRDHFLAARTIEHVHGRAWTLVEADARKGRRRRRRAEEIVADLEHVDGVLRVPPSQTLEDPTLVGRLVTALVRTGAVLDRETAGRLRRETQALEAPLHWHDDLRRRFVGALWAGRPVLRVLAELDDVGLFEALVPEWTAVRGRAQRNPFHRYSLDRHAFHAAAELGELVRHETWAADALEVVEDRDALMLGVLLHDVGKAFGEPHAETGVPAATAIAGRMGLPASSRDRVAALVRLHLLLPDVATRRDLADPAEIQQVAAVVGDRETLASLHLLAAADGLATGPTAWTSWKAALVQELVTKVDAVLDDRDPDALADGARATAHEAQELAPELGVDPDVVRAHLALLPSRYAASVSPRAVVRQAAMAVTRPEPAEVRTRVTPGPSVTDEVAYDELDVVAVDTPGMFAKVAGVLALHGGSVVQAHAYTRDDDVAVDTFTVQKPEHATASWWVQVEGDLVEAVAGRLAVRARVARKRASEERRISKLPDVETRVTAGMDASGRATVVEVHTLDRIGVLYRIASALAELELDIVVAKVATLGHEVVDSFTVRDAAGQPLDDDHRRELDLAITTALAE